MSEQEKNGTGKLYLVSATTRNDGIVLREIFEDLHDALEFESKFVYKQLREQYGEKVTKDDSLTIGFSVLNIRGLNTPKTNTPTIYGLYSSRGNNEWLQGADTDPEVLRLRYNAHQQSLTYPDPDPEIPEGKRIIKFLGTTSGGLDFPPHCYTEIRIIDQFDKKR